MHTHADARRIALARPEADEAPHFDSTAFRVRKKIFCTMGENGPDITLKLSPEDQHNLFEDDPDSIRPVSGYWGRNGWTQVTIEAMDPARLESLIRMAWAAVAPKRLLKP